MKNSIVVMWSRGRRQMAVTMSMLSMALKMLLDLLLPRMMDKICRVTHKLV